MQNRNRIQRGQEDRWLALSSGNQLFLQSNNKEIGQEHLLGSAEIKVPLIFNTGLFGCINMTSERVLRDSRWAKNGVSSGFPRYFPSWLDKRTVPIAPSWPRAYSTSLILIRISLVQGHTRAEEWMLGSRNRGNKIVDLRRDNIWKMRGGVEGEYCWIGLHKLGSFSVSEYQLVPEISELTAATHYSDIIISLTTFRDDILG